MPHDDQAKPPTSDPVLPDLLASTPVDGTSRDGSPQQRRWHIPDGWSQGRGAWGGLVVGACARAALVVADAGGRPSRRLRSLSAQIVAPVPAGTVTLTPSLLRAGSGTDTVAVRVEGRPADKAGAPAGDITLLCHAVTVLGDDRAPDLRTDAWPGAEPPGALARAWSDVPAVPVGPPFGPVFAPHLEYRPIRGLPLSGEPEVLGWVRMRRPVAVADECYLAAIVDAYWPACLPLLPTLRPIATLTFALDLPAPHPDRPLPASDDGSVAPLLHRGRVLAASAGYVVETRELWTADARLVAWNTQTVAVIR